MFEKYPVWNFVFIRKFNKISVGKLEYGIDFFYSMGVFDQIE